MISNGHMKLQDVSIFWEFLIFVSNEIDRSIVKATKHEASDEYMGMMCLNQKLRVMVTQPL
jgi:hypothetical protein